VFLVKLDYDELSVLVFEFVALAGEPKSFFGLPFF
jgi:hypothetical protein